MNDLIQELEQAFQMLSTIPVCGDAVDRMARARAHLVNACRIERARLAEIGEDGHEAAGAAAR